MDRKALIMSEFHTWLDDSCLVSEFMNLSDRASAIRKEKIKAAKEGATYIG